MVSPTNYNKQFLESALLGDCNRLKKLLENKSKNDIQFDAEATVDELTAEDKKSVFDAATKIYSAHALSFAHLPEGMNALHLACYVCHESVIQHLITHTPALLEKRCKGIRATPLITLTENMGTVNVISDVFFEKIFRSVSFDALVTTSDNIFHYLSLRKRDIEKLTIAIKILKEREEGIKKELKLSLSLVPVVLIDIIMDYRNDLRDLLNAKNFYGRTVYQVACKEAKPILATEGASTEEFDYMGKSLLGKYNYT